LFALSSTPYHSAVPMPAEVCDAGAVCAGSAVLMFGCPEA
jgi:hypothetical protein